MEISCVITNKKINGDININLQGFWETVLLVLCCLDSDLFYVLVNILVRKLLPSIFTRFSIACVRDLLKLLFTF